MRKPRDFDSELKALEQRARSLRARKVQQLGELLEAAEANQAAKEAWRRRGASFFRKSGETGDRAQRQSSEPQARDGAAQPAAGDASA